MSNGGGPMYGPLPGNAGPGGPPRRPMPYPNPTYMQTKRMQQPNSLFMMGANQGQQQQHFGPGFPGNMGPGPIRPNYTPNSLGTPPQPGLGGGGGGNGMVPGGGLFYNQNMPHQMMGGGVGPQGVPNPGQFRPGGMMGGNGGGGGFVGGHGNGTSGNSGPPMAPNGYMPHPGNGQVL